MENEFDTAKSWEDLGIQDPGSIGLGSGELATIGHGDSESGFDLGLPDSFEISEHLNKVHQAIAGMFEESRQIDAMTGAGWDEYLARAEELSFLLKGNQDGDGVQGMLGSLTKDELAAWLSLTSPSNAPSPEAVKEAWDNYFGRKSGNTG